MRFHCALALVLRFVFLFILPVTQPHPRQVQRSAAEAPQHGRPQRRTRRSTSRPQQPERFLRRLTSVYRILRWRGALRDDGDDAGATAGEAGAAGAGGVAACAVSSRCADNCSFFTTSMACANWARSSRSRLALTPAALNPIKFRRASRSPARPAGRPYRKQRILGPPQRLLGFSIGGVRAQIGDLLQRGAHLRRQQLLFLRFAIRRRFTGILSGWARSEALQLVLG